MTMPHHEPRGTVTLARLYAQQGHWDRAAVIYRALLQADPGRQDLRQALAEAETHRSQRAIDGLAPLFREWIELLFRHDRLRRLRRLRGRL
jgi:cytochrome c-type biogenesis protein CcmH/NrfG